MLPCAPGDLYPQRSRRAHVKPPSFVMWADADAGCAAETASSALVALTSEGTPSWRERIRGSPMRRPSTCTLARWHVNIGQVVISVHAVPCRGYCWSLSSEISLLPFTIDFQSPTHRRRGSLSCSNPSNYPRSRYR